MLRAAGFQRVRRATIVKFVSDLTMSFVLISGYVWSRGDVTLYSGEPLSVCVPRRPMTYWLIDVCRRSPATTDGRRRCQYGIIYHNQHSTTWPLPPTSLSTPQLSHGGDSGRARRLRVPRRQQRSRKICRQTPAAQQSGRSVAEIFCSRWRQQRINVVTADRGASSARRGGHVPRPRPRGEGHVPLGRFGRRSSAGSRRGVDGTAVDHVTCSHRPRHPHTVLDVTSVVRTRFSSRRPTERLVL